ncbi:MAG: HD domain-containing protein [Prosthecobacter sp.]
MNWNDTRLWKELEHRSQLLASSSPKSELKQIMAILTLEMPEIETILSDGGTSRLDFTLHDSNHSFRVAERIVDLIPTGLLESLGEYELVLLLLSSYLHDIGMTPSQRKIQGLEELLLDGETSKLADSETAEFRKWLDNANDPGLVDIPAKARVVDATINAKIRYTITHFARYRHNAWSEEWMKDRFIKGGSEWSNGKLSLGEYKAWLDDLIILCRSHHEGRQELLGNRFQPRLAGRLGKVVNLRFLACLLRLADILEFAPWRTPDVLHRHREVDKRSMVYWRKDHVVTAKLETSPVYRLCIEARPEDARVHCAVETMIREIDQELATCRFVADECHFDRMPGVSGALPHFWPWPACSHSNIRPRDEAYVFIKGAFRPNTSKLIQLLSGTQLWGSPTAAIREILQNAFDAVREQMAYKRLSCVSTGQMPPADQSWEQFLGNMHQVRLILERRENEFWIICQDDGIGMNRPIIEHHFLVSGNAVRHSVKQLERICSAAGFELGRTGQFGIGVLSYFMIGDVMKLTTRRTQVAGDDESNGWCFTTDGAGDWGQLTKAHCQTGTKLEIKLHDHLVESLADFPHAWVEYLKNMLLHVPCRFMFDFCGQKWEVDPGWTHDNKHWEAKLFDKWTEHLAKNRERDLQPQSVRNYFVADDVAWNSFLQTALSRLRFQNFERRLESGLGNVRVTIPYFDIDGSRALIFPFVDSSGRVSCARARAGLLPDGFILTAWRGMEVLLDEDVHGSVYQMRTSYGTRYAPNIITEIDFRTGVSSSLSVDRKNLRLDAATSKVLFAELSEMIDCLGKEFVDGEPNSPWRLLNGAVFGLETPLYPAAQWPIKKSLNAPVEIGGLVYPCILKGDIDGLSGDYSFATGAGDKREVNILENWKHALASYSNAGNNSISSDYPKVFRAATKVALFLAVDCSEMRLVRVWESEPCMQVPLFPPTWHNVVGARFSDYQRILNLFCPLTSVLRVGPDVQSGIEEQINHPEKLRRLIESTRSSIGRAQILLAVVTCQPINSDQTVLWNGIIEAFPGLIGDVWRECELPTDEGGNASPLLFISNGYGHMSWRPKSKPQIMSFAPSGASFLDEDEGWMRLVRTCPINWMVHLV